MRHKILLIDDSPFFLKVLSDALGDEFYTEIAISAEVAFEKLNASSQDTSERSKPFDLIVTDLHMPGLSGYDVAEYVKGLNRVNKFIPVIMVTSEEITKEEARKHGCAAYIPKSNLAKIVSMAKILTKGLK